MDIQALVFDLDGTAIPNKPDGMPSKVVIEAVKKIKQSCHVSIATGRSLELCSKILEALDIEDLCILNGGTHLYSRKTNEYIWKQEIDAITLTRLFTRLEQFSQYQVADEKSLKIVPIKEYATDKPVALSCIFSTTDEDAKAITSIVSEIDGITAHVLNSWKNGTFDIHITHELATKKHALQSLLSYLNVETDKTMVVGDGGNDLPLFELAGLKVAMGNAAPELKANADWIAPSVDDDGLAVAIEQYILK